MKRNLLKSIIVSALLGMSGLAATFNRNATATAVTPVPAPASRKSGYRTGIKGMASSNNTRYGEYLRDWFALPQHVRDSMKADRA